MKTADDLYQAVLSVILNSQDQPFDDNEFNRLALDLFSFQFEHNDPYRVHCHSLFQTPDTIDHWSEIPAVPSSAFKHVTVSTFPAGTAVARFDTSGTTAQQTGHHYFQSLALYNAAAMASFQKFMLPDDVRLPVLILAPSPEEMPHSSLSYMLGLVRQNCGTDDSCFYVVDGALQAETLDHQLEQATQSDQPVMVLGTAFAYMHWLEYCQDHNRTFRLPAGSRLMETGGFKGRSRTLSKHQLYQQLSVNLGIPRTQMVNEYGMTELSTQFYDETLVCGQPTDDKVLPPWARIMFIDPRTGHPCGLGEVGMMRILDLANIGSSICLATEDLGLAVDPNRFQVLGRASEAGARGCSLTMVNLAAIS